LHIKGGAILNIVWASERASQQAGDYRYDDRTFCSILSTKYHQLKHLSLQYAVRIHSSSLLEARIRDKGKKRREKRKDTGWEKAAADCLLSSDLEALREASATRNARTSGHCPLVPEAATASQLHIPEDRAQESC
jgi:hypothetical protein